MRALLLMVVLTATALPALTQQPGPRPGQGPGMNVPERWLPFDSLATALELTDEQRARAEDVHRQIDSIVRQGATVRGEMRAEMQRNRDPQQAQRFRQRLENMQQRADRLLRNLRDQLTDPQRTALEGVRPPLVMPPRPQRN
ncbi:MAG: hypothetical protein WD934_06845 [Gemmatimonadales bacterium]